MNSDPTEDQLADEIANDNSEEETDVQDHDNNHPGEC